MSIQTFNVTSPEFWNPSDDYNLYYTGSWKAGFTFFIDNHLRINIGNSFWEEYKDTPLLRIDIYGSNKWTVEHDDWTETSVENISFSTNLDIYGSSERSTSSASLDFSDHSSVIRVGDFNAIGFNIMGDSYDSSNGISSIIFTLDVLEEGAQLVWRYPMSVREKY